MQTAKKHKRLGRHVKKLFAARLGLQGNKGGASGGNEGFDVVRSILLMLIFRQLQLLGLFMSDSCPPPLTKSIDSKDSDAGNKNT